MTYSGWNLGVVSFVFSRSLWSALSYLTARLSHGQALSSKWDNEILASYEAYPVGGISSEKLQHSRQGTTIRAFQRPHRLRLVGAPRILRNHRFFVNFEYLKLFNNKNNYLSIQKPSPASIARFSFLIAWLIHACGRFVSLYLWTFLNYFASFLSSAAWSFFFWLLIDWIASRTLMIPFWDSGLTWCLV